MSIIDREQLLEHIEGDLELLQDTYEMFCEESESLQSQLNTAFSAGELQSFCDHAHSVKGMLSNFLADAACQTAAELEAIENQEQLAAAQPMLDQLRHQIAMVQAELKQILQTG